jgi:hypothetical protein
MSIPAGVLARKNKRPYKVFRILFHPCGLQVILVADLDPRIVSCHDAKQLSMGMLAVLEALQVQNLAKELDGAQGCMQPRLQVQENECSRWAQSNVSSEWRPSRNEAHAYIVT